MNAGRVGELVRELLVEAGRGSGRDGLLRTRRGAMAASLRFQRRA